MKKTLLILLTLSVLFAFISCGEAENSPSADTGTSEISTDVPTGSEVTLSSEDAGEEAVSGESSEDSSATSSEDVFYVTFSSADVDVSYENVSSADGVDSAVSKDDSSAGFKTEVLSDKTYSVYLIKNDNGTYTVTAIIPANVLSGKLVVSASKNLKLIKGSLSTAVPGGIVNENYNRNGISGACVAFASATSLAEGTVVFTASYTAADGVGISASDITVPDWNLTSGSNYIGTGKDSKVAVKYISE